MRKGIGITVLIYTLVHLVGLFLIRILGGFLTGFFQVGSNSFKVAFFLLSMGVISVVLISLGFHLNRKYAGWVKYWKYVLFGTVISFNSSVIHLFLITAYNEYNFTGFLSISAVFQSFAAEFNNTIPLFISVFFVLCMVIAIFRKKYKTKGTLFNDDNDSESLDSDILND